MIVSEEPTEALRVRFVPLQLLTVASAPQEALTYFNVTTKQKEMLEFAQNYLQTDDEVRSCRARTKALIGFVW